MVEETFERIDPHLCIFVYYSQGRGCRCQNVSVNSCQVLRSQSAALDPTVVSHPWCLDFSAEDMDIWLERKAEASRDARERVLVSIYISSPFTHITVYDTDVYSLYQ